jgi:hypothetical protein
LYINAMKASMNELHRLKHALAWNIYPRQRLCP